MWKLREKQFVPYNEFTINKRPFNKHIQFVKDEVEN